MRDATRRIVLACSMVGLFALGGCGDSSTAPAAPLNLTGTWAGFTARKGLELRCASTGRPYAPAMSYPALPRW